MKKKEINRKEDLELFMMITRLAWPTMLEQLLHTMVQYIDTAMVGSLGTEATAAVGATGTVNWLVSGTISALSIGFLSYIAKARGAKDGHQVKRASAQAAVVVIIVGCLFTLLMMAVSKRVPVWMQVDPEIRQMAGRYFMILYSPMLFRTASIIFGNVLRAVEDTKTPMKVGIIVNIVNVVLNFLLIYPIREMEIAGKAFLIYGAGMGVMGAALASAASFCVGGILITIKFFRHKEISPLGEKIVPDWSILHPCLKVALPNMMQRFGTSLGYVVFASMINSAGEVATAAHTIANTVESLFYIPGFGMQTAAATLAGNAYGARNERKMKQLPSVFIPLETGMMFLSGSLLFLVAPILMGIFSKNREVIELGAVVLRMVAVSEPFYGFSIIIEGFMQGVGRTKTPFVYNMIGMWGIRIVGTFFCITIFQGGLIHAWACMILHNLFLFFFFLRVYKKRKWNPLEVSAVF